MLYGVFYFVTADAAPMQEPSTIDIPTISLPGAEHESSPLDNLTLPANDNPASCMDKNYYWYDQSGPDSVKPKPIESDNAVIQADQITGITGGGHYATGNVVGYKNDKTIVADWLIYNQQHAQATAGNFVMTRQYDTVQGKWLDYYLDLDKGTMVDATALENKSDLYVHGAQINVQDKAHYSIESMYVTSCGSDNPAWHISGSHGEINNEDSMGTIYNMKFYAESLPLMSLPYSTFPLGQRKSGFLTPPVLQSSSNVGLGVGIPYYWNMAPNYDLTFTPMIYSGTGLFTSTQFRYMTSNSTGELYTEQVPYQWNNNQYRYDYHLFDKTKLESNLLVGYEYNKVSDSNYFVDYGNLDAIVNSVNLPQTAYATYTPSWGYVNLNVQAFQTLNPTDSLTINQQVVAIYSTLPQFTFNVNPYKIGNSPFKLGLQSQYTNFQSGQVLSGFSVSNSSQFALQNGQRTVIYPSLTMPLSNQWGFITPKVGYSYTNYTLEPYQNTQTGYSTINRGIPITSLDSGLTFDRQVSLLNNSYEQTLEPRLYYLYIPSVNQANIPLFDTAPATYNLDQLFSENRFSGYDRINAANDLTLGLSSQLINNDDGTQYANWGVGYRYYITQPNNLLYGNYTQFQQLYLPQPNLIAQLANNWSDKFTTNISGQYSTIYDNIDQYSFQMQYKPEQYKVFNLKFNYQYEQPLLYYPYVPGQAYTPATYENQYALDLSAQWPLTNHWMLEGRMNYDFTAGVMMNALAGIKYDGGCWGIHLVAENYITNINQFTQAEYIVFSLKGIGDNLGYGDPTPELIANIPGYTPVTSIH